MAPVQHVQFSHDMAEAINQFAQALTSEQTMGEMAGEDSVSWKTLVSRLTEEQVETLVNNLFHATDAYDAYYDEAKWEHNNETRNQ